ncbi:MAG TPA: LysR family transcriptional regulator [Burkholderiales bacterium]|jgi:DNA-binding transcriptional LysR family regulator|nr:LysR family transcriptional regulator [Burkholderiales bacterium]
MDLRDIEYFAVIAEHGHLGRAAEALGLGQPALSMSLRRLEDSAKAKLVKRTPRGVELTVVGTALLSHVQRLRLARDDLKREVSALGQGLAGHVRICVIPGLDEEIVGAAQSALLEAAPEVTLRIAVLEPGTLLPALSNGEFDLAVTMIPPAIPDDLGHEHLLDDEFVVCASTKHRLARRKRLTLRDLVQERWVTNLDGSAAWWKAVLAAFEQQGLPPPRVAIETSSRLQRYHAVASTSLLGLTSSLMMRKTAQRFPLLRLPVTELKWKRRNGVFYRRGGYLPPAAARLIEILKSTASQVALDKR